MFYPGFFSGRGGGIDLRGGEKARAPPPWIKHWSRPLGQPTEFVLFFLKPIFRMQMMNRELILILINLIDLKNVELTRVSCECLYYFSFDSNLLKFIYENGLKKLKDLLERIHDPSIFCSIMNILTEFIRKNEYLSNDLILNMIEFIKNSSDLFYLSRIFKSLNQLTKLNQTIQLFKQENIYPNLIFHLENQIKNYDIQLNILSILQQCGKDKQSAQ